MQSEAHMSEQKAQTAMIDAARLADELRAEQVIISIVLASLKSSDFQQCIRICNNNNKNYSFISTSASSVV